MLSLCIENFCSFCVIMLLLWFDFHRNIPCLCYATLLCYVPCLCYLVCLSSRYSSRNRSQIDMKYPSCLKPPYLTLHRCAKILQNISWFSPLQKPAKKLYHLYFEFQCELVLVCWWKKPCIFLNFCIPHFGRLGL